jgi:hypothetical protein
MDVIYMIIAAVLGVIAGYQLGLHDKEWKGEIDNGNTGSSD